MVRPERARQRCNHGGGRCLTLQRTHRPILVPFGSCYGDRVDVQGWFDAIVTASAEDGAPQFVDLFYPEADTRQAYTARFGGTSGASPMVAATAAAFNGFWTQRSGAPLSPMDLRAAMVSTGHPQQEDGDTHPIGPQPDLRRLLRVYGVR